ncbi:nucleotide exchange factor GrpE [Aliiruegeria sabulilitoris]|uniref:nucleotide exchange factor GrpE n=1 Tax=Aliiruegeria sabulilitoris TaxID=1510458 RepID=UPI000836528F|nr:nucleotide exchange factor GrpE [Aliiruegeria sabulilitoris]NDR57522.1 nucleotide exchange factor GrpE [Pseudoruegeria sp. M32A2M]
MAEATKDENLEEQVEEISIEGLAEEAEDFMSDPLETDDELDAIKAERDEFRDRFMRALADAENARKRGERDRREAEQYGGSKLARDMLPVYDNLNRALEAATEDQRAQAAALIEGVELTLRELLNVFTKHGITLVKPEIGEKFDPQIHQAMFEAPVPNTSAGDIIQVLTEGFLLHDRLLRPAQVGVSSTPAG